MRPAHSGALVLERELPRVTFIHADGTHTTHRVAVGRTIMDCALDNQVTGIRGQCGGAGICGTCQCYVAAPWFAQLPMPIDDETDLLPFLPDPRPNSRLACQITLTAALDGIVVAVPERQV